MSITSADLCSLLLTRGVRLIFVEIFILSTLFAFAPGGIEPLKARSRAGWLSYV